MEFEHYSIEELGVEPIGAKVLIRKGNQEEILEVKENNEEFVVLYHPEKKIEYVIYYHDPKEKLIKETKNTPSVYKIDQPLSTLLHKRYTYISNNPVENVYRSWDELKRLILKVKNNDSIKKEIRKFERFLNKFFS